MLICIEKETASRQGEEGKREREFESWNLGSESSGSSDYSVDSV